MKTIALFAVALPLVPAASIQDSPPVKARIVRVADVGEDLEIMRRILAREMVKARPKICGNSSNLVSSFLFGHMQTVEGEYMNATGQLSQSDAFGGSSDYVPRVGGLMHFTVPVAMTLVEPSQEKAEVVENSGAAEKTVWEEMEEQVRSKDTTTILGSISILSQHMKPQTRTFSTDALKALEDTVIDTLLRYGHHVTLQKDEALVVVVKLRSKEVVTAGNLGFLAEASGRQSVETEKGLPTKMVAYVTAADLEQFEAGVTLGESIRRRVELTYLVDERGGAKN